jgi:putative intracellular protease/amidase
MPKSKDYVFVLWGSEFEEMTATIFVTELRRAGLWVKVVGLTRRRSNGVCGLALVPDLTLEEALPLACHTICVVIPCGWPNLKRLKNDPRLPDFFDQAHTNQAKFVIGPLREADLVKLKLFPITSDNVMVYPHQEDLVGFVHELAGLLSTNT